MLRTLLLQLSQKLVTLLIGSLLLASPANAQIKKWVDEDGKVHYSAKAPPGKTHSSIRAATPSDTNLSEAGTQTDSVVLYTTSWCGYCKKARRYLNAAQVDYKEVDIERSRVGKFEFSRFGGQGVPLLVRGEESIRGFSATRYQQFLSLD